MILLTDKQQKEFNKLIDNLVESTQTLSTEFNRLILNLQKVCNDLLQKYEEDFKKWGWQKCYQCNEWTRPEDLKDAQIAEDPDFSVKGKICRKCDAYFQELDLEESRATGN